MELELETHRLVVLDVEFFPRCVTGLSRIVTISGYPVQHWHSRNFCSLKWRAMRRFSKFITLNLFTQLSLRAERGNPVC